MRPLLLCAILIGFALGSEGCGAYKAVTQPPRVDIAALKSERMTRDMVIERLGQPRVVTKHEDGGSTEQFEFYEGSETVWRVGRGVVHSVGAVATYGAWELVATPIEFAVRGDKLVGEAEFDSEGRLRSFIIVGRDVKVRESGDGERNRGGTS